MRKNTRNSKKQERDRLREVVLEVQREAADPANARPDVWRQGAVDTCQEILHRGWELVPKVGG